MNEKEEQKQNYAKLVGVVEHGITKEGKDYYYISNKLVTKEGKEIELSRTYATPIITNLLEVHGLVVTDEK